MIKEKKEKETQTEEEKKKSLADETFYFLSNAVERLHQSQTEPLTTVRKTGDLGIISDLLFAKFKFSISLIKEKKVCSLNSGFRRKLKSINPFDENSKNEKLRSESVELRYYCEMTLS